MSLQAKLCRYWELLGTGFLTMDHGARACWAGWRDPSGQRELLVARRYGLALLRLLRLEVAIEGLENARDLTHCAVAATHASYLDAVVLMAHFPLPLHFIAKKELAWFPVIGGHLKRCGVMIDRQKGESARTALRRAVDEKQAGAILIFPEGTRSHDGSIQPFHRGGLSVLLEAGLSVVPVCITGTFENFSRNSIFASKKMNPRMIICPAVRGVDFASIDEAVSEVEARVRRARTLHSQE